MDDHGESNDSQGPSSGTIFLVPRYLVPRKRTNHIDIPLLHLPSLTVLGPD